MLQVRRGLVPPSGQPNGIPAQTSDRRPEQKGGFRMPCQGGEGAYQDPRVRPTPPKRPESR